MIHIVTWNDRHLPAFRRLNLAWLEGHDLLEAGDFKHLDHPRESILDTGGEIFLAMDGDEVVGTCGIARSGDDRAEIVKLSTDDRVRGQGVGRRLTEAALDWAREHGIRVIFLVSSSKLTAALRLYERMGFEHRPLPPDPGYATVDVYMELTLHRT